MSNENQQYEVSWIVDQEAPSFIEAAINARSDQLPGSEALMFHVKKVSSGERQFINLLDLEDYQEQAFSNEVNSLNQLQIAAIAVLSAAGLNVNSVDNDSISSQLIELSNSSLDKPGLPSRILLHDDMSDDDLLKLAGHECDLEKVQYYRSDNQPIAVWTPKLGGRNFVQREGYEFLFQSSMDAIKESIECEKAVRALLKKRNLTTLCNLE